MATEIPRSGVPVGRGAIRTGSEGPGTRAASCVPQTMRPPVCVNCGHDSTTHRGGRCWVDALGLPIYRTRSLIDCKCDTYQEDQ